MKQKTMKNGKQPPGGITMASPQQGEYIIHHRPTGMWGIKIFLLLWFSGWTFGCLMVLRAYLNGGTMDDGSPISFWFVAFFWVPEIIVAVILARLFFYKSVFYLDRRNLVLETSILGLFKKSRSISRHAIKKIVQTSSEDNGSPSEGRSIASWGLEVEQAGGRQEKLLSFQPYQKSWWLGQFFAQWAEVDFFTSSKIQEIKEIHTASLNSDQSLPEGITVRSSDSKTCAVEYELMPYPQKVIVLCVGAVVSCLSASMMISLLLMFTYHLDSILFFILALAMTGLLTLVLIQVFRIIYGMTCRTTFHLDRHSLIIEENFFGRKKHRSIELRHIKQFVHSCEPVSKKEGALIRWGLKAEGKEESRLLAPGSDYNLPQWLGRYLAERSGIAFVTEK